MFLIRDIWYVSMYWVKIKILYVCTRTSICLVDGLFPYMLSCFSGRMRKVLLGVGNLFRATSWELFVISTNMFIYFPCQKWAPTPLPDHVAPYILLLTHNRMDVLLRHKGLAPSHYISRTGRSRRPQREGLPCLQVSAGTRHKRVFLVG